MSALAQLRALGDRAPWRLITLHEGRGVVCLIDEIDYAFATQWRWNCGWWPSTPHKIYPKRNIGAARATVYLHREILKRADPIDELKQSIRLGDHINGQSLDARRANLRWATHAENNANRIPRHAVPSLERIVAGLLATLARAPELEDLPGW